MTNNDNHHAPNERARPHDIFAWRGDEVVLVADHSDGRWHLARSWAHGDRLVDVRRWSFATPEALAAQVRRLAREATGNVALAIEAAAAALAWGATPGEGAVGDQPAPNASPPDPDPHH